MPALRLAHSSTALATVEVRKPSTQLDERAGADRDTTQEKLAHELRGDLDVITLKALAKEPGERYESAAAMAEDIARYLQHRPIRARPAPLSYRAGKFVRRNRPMIGVSALAGVVVLAIGSYELEHRWAVPLYRSIRHRSRSRCCRWRMRAGTRASSTSPMGSRRI